MKKIRKWWKERQAAPVSDQQRVRNMLYREVAFASALAGFLANGLNRGRAVKITVEIDGTACDIGIMATAKEPLVEYLANWACVELIAKRDRLDEFDKRVGEGQETGRIQDVGQKEGETMPGF